MIIRGSSGHECSHAWIRPEVAAADLQPGIAASSLLAASVLTITMVLATTNIGFCWKKKKGGGRDDSLNPVTPEGGRRKVAAYAATPRTSLQPSHLAEVPVGYSMEAAAGPVSPVAQDGVPDPIVMFAQKKPSLLSVDIGEDLAAGTAANRQSFGFGAAPPVTPEPLALYQKCEDMECIDSGKIFNNEKEPFYYEEGPKMPAQSGRVQDLTDMDKGGLPLQRTPRAKGDITYQYRNLGGFEDLGNIHPKQAYDEATGSNQALFDIVMVRLSLINEDFVHRSRYTSGQPFGFTHDVLIAPPDTFFASDDQMKFTQEEEDSYGSSTNLRQGNVF